MCCKLHTHTFRRMHIYIYLKHKCSKILLQVHFAQVFSKAGYGGLASRAPRFSDQIKILEEPKITYKEVIHKQVFKQNKAPFNSSVPRKTGMADQEDVPG